MKRGKQLTRVQEARALFVESPGAHVPDFSGGGLGGAPLGPAAASPRGTLGQSMLLTVGSILLTASGSLIGYAYTWNQERVAKIEKLAAARLSSLNSIAATIDTRTIRAAQVQKTLRIGAPANEIALNWNAYQDSFVAYNENSVKMYRYIRTVLQTDKKSFFEYAINNDVTPVLSTWDRCLSYAYMQRIAIERDGAFANRKWWDDQYEIAGAARDCKSPTSIIRDCSQLVLEGLNELSTVAPAKVSGAETEWISNNYGKIRTACPTGYAVYWEENGKDPTRTPLPYSTRMKGRYAPDFGEGSTARRRVEIRRGATFSPEENLGSPPTPASGSPSASAAGRPAPLSSAPPPPPSTGQGGGIADLLSRSATTASTRIGSIFSGRAQAAERH